MFDLDDTHSYCAISLCDGDRQRLTLSRAQRRNLSLSLGSMRMGQLIVLRCTSAETVVERCTRSHVRAEHVRKIARKERVQEFRHCFVEIV